MKILGIETSCDETAAAVSQDGTAILSSIVSSQVAVHAPYGGVVPELASRNHIKNILPVVNQALAAADLKAEELDAVAATQRPGLVGALLVGFSFAKAFAYGLGIPFIGVDHLDGHMASVLLKESPPPYPFVALLASGGHTAVYHVISPTNADLMGRTRDDAVGEAFDKAAKMMGLGYPGGRVIEELAARGDDNAIFFTRPYLDKKSFDFSFSGIKTAVSRCIQEAGADLENQKADIAAGFQAAVGDVLCHKLIHAAEVKTCRDIALVGGVAANTHIREQLAKAAATRGLTVHMPPLAYCGDNAAMIAIAGYHYFQQNRTTGLADDVYSRAATR
ncbi:MAG: tRNA (adenosine(37)-N6)-threonylcarbamoyltransferase complex transferase subunit TsaD [Thermodesulfobacteriota bacterium]|nr:tRNA (adenosine(37)-N6)-threonylcarbamoyltransferase complex transferase subunit TsaD [Thermodesulfobacteriota bacterium]